MDSLFRKVRKSPQDGKKAGKHSKLGEGWDTNREAVTEGVGFYLKYLGSTLLEELPLGESYGEGISSRAVQRIVDMAKTTGKKLGKVSLKVTPHGIKVVDMETKAVNIDLSIYRISFCTADKNHDKVFAFIARNTINETMECHAFYCAKEKIAQAVTLSVSQAFSLARDKWENANNMRNSPQQQNSSKKMESRVGSESTRNQTISVPLSRKIQSAPQIDLLSDTHPRLPKPESTKSLRGDDLSDSPRHRLGWQTFGDDNNVKFSLEEEEEADGEDDDSDDDFSKLAENRSRKQSFPTFSTDLRREDLDDSVQDYLDGSKCLEAFSKTRSVEDLMNI